jgi:putative redox protein
MSTVIVRGGVDGLAQAIEAGPHRLTGDEPPPAGGDTGPSPYDYLLVALGA